MQDTAKYKQLFISSAKEQIEVLQKGIDSLQLAYDPVSVEVVHRAAHSLKGEALLMGYSQVGALCLGLEKIAQKYNDEQTQIPDETLRMFSNAIQQLEKSLQIIDTSGTEPDLQEIIQEFDTVRKDIGMV